jgi:hypothetical protein
MTDKDKKRSFRIIAISQDDNINFYDGIYHGKSPSQAALKAFSWYCRKVGLESCSRKFTLQEITKGSKSYKSFHYIGNRELLSTPKEIIRNDKKYIVRYKTQIKKTK